MGEARRRQEAGTQHSHRISAAHDPLPDFLFGRIPDLQAESGFPIAGHLFTNIPRREAPTQREADLICRVIRSLANDMADQPEITQVALWLNRQRPADAPSPPFDDDLLRARGTACYMVEVMVDPEDLGDFIAVSLPPPPSIMH